MSIVKDPDANLGHRWDFPHVLQAGDTISSHVVTVEAGTAVNGARGHDPPTVTTWASRLAPIGPEILDADRR